MTDWHHKRRKVLGGSDQAAYLGLCVYDGDQGPVVVWKQKTQGWRRTQTDAMKRGHLLEPEICARFAADTGYILEQGPEHLRHPRFPEVPLGGNADRRIVGRYAECLEGEERSWVEAWCFDQQGRRWGRFRQDRQGILEAKSTRSMSRVWSCYRNDRLPLSHVLQVHVYAVCEGVTWGYATCACVQGSDTRPWIATMRHLPWRVSKPLLYEMELAATEWWQAYVLTNTRPPEGMHPRAERIAELVRRGWAAKRRPRTMTKTNTELAKTGPAPAAGVPAHMQSVASLAEVERIAGYLVDSGLWTDRQLPPRVAKAQIVGKILYGQEIGLPPIAALQAVNVIQGKPALSAGGIAARIKSSGKYDYRVVRRDNEGCVLEWYEGKRKLGTSEFTTEDAKRAGLNGANWKKYPKSMCFARAVTDGQRTYAPDIFFGSVYTPEEIESVQASATVIPGPDTSGAGWEEEGVIDAEPVEETYTVKHIVGLVKQHCLTPDEETRIFDALKLKAGVESSGDLTEHDCREWFGRLSKLADEDKLHKWAIQALAGDEKPDSPWNKANKRLHAVYHNRREDLSLTNDDLHVLHDLARCRSGLAPDAPWQETDEKELHELADIIDALDERTVGETLRQLWPDLVEKWRASHEEADHAVA